MNDDDLYRFCEELNIFLSKRFNYKKHYCKVWINKIDARTSKYSLTLSWRSYANKISITAISFSEKRKGHCTTLLQFLIQLADKYGYERIEFISISTEPMKCFVKKFKFTNHPSTSFFDEEGVLSDDWSRSISELKNLLEPTDIDERI